MKNIIINKNLKFNFDDLMQYVDIHQSFTLKDVLNCIKRSKISIETLKKIFKCKYLEEYIEEVNKENEDIKNNVEFDHLELCSEIGSLDDKREITWSFCGIGKENGTGVEKYAMDFTPLYKIANFKIKISDIMINYDLDNKKVIKTKINPLIMFVEFLYVIIEEISWNGSIKNRDARLKELKRRLDCIKNKKNKC
jgi:hypothetical protein